ncbi:MAG: VCBS repeat-containing protein, partial [Balneolales bacterium]
MPSPLFEKLNPEETGIHFENTITSSDSLNVQDFPFIYNGGGVAAGDIDGDGLPDLFFTGNQVSSRLYLNKGNMYFEDITDSAGVATTRWASGASMVDINGNGRLDIYVSVAGPGNIPSEERANLLFINNGDGTFTESAPEYNLADTSFTTHAAFLDYNGDGYLDVYLLNNSPVDFARGAVSDRPAILGSGSTASYDKLYRNNGNGTFTDVSREAGLVEELGYGLGVAVGDLNRDGWPDIYISNDIQPRDVLYINNGDGTFTDKTAEWLKHTSFAGMGTDIADFNNDGWPDILQVDMMPE